MNFKNLFLGTIALTFLGAILFWLIATLSPPKPESALAEDPGNIFVVCPECHLKLRVSPEMLKAGVACPHCVHEGVDHKGVKMERVGGLLGRPASGTRFYWQLLSIGMIGADGIMLFLCYYYYVLRPRARKRKQETIFLNCTCPTCHRKYRFKRSQVGQPYQCRNCRRNFVFPDPEARVPPKVKVAAVSSPPKSQARTALLPGEESPHDINRKRFFLIVASGSKRGLPIRVDDDLFLIGSEKECQLRSNQPGIGPRHCSLVMRLNKVFVRDWDSGQPTLVNGELLPPDKEWPVHAGDRIRVGPIELLVQFREPNLAQQDLEEWALQCLDEDQERDEQLEYQADLGFSPDRLAGASDVAAQVIAKMMDNKGVEEGRLRIFEQADIVIIRFNDARLVDESEIALVRKEIQDHVYRPGMRILLDFKNVRRLSAAAVEMLVDLYRWLRGQQSQLALCRLAPELQWILQTLNAIQPVEHFPDKVSAMKSSW
jgi:anti-anti-sigma regulatory factor/pSer/pThr/pTyr-binding forkhead associated (FHA) protein